MKDDEFSIEKDFLRHLDLGQSEVLNRTRVQVHVKLAEVSMSVAEILDLVPGQIVKLPNSIAKGVTLMVGEEIVASATIVKRDSPDLHKGESRTEYALQIVHVALDEQ